MAKNPTITYTIKDVNPKTVALTGDDSVLVKYTSYAYVAMYPQAYDGAAIDLDMCIMRNGSLVTSGTEYTFYGVENENFRFSVQDSKGNFGSAEATCEMVDYIKLTCNHMINRPDGSGYFALKCYGEYFNGSFGAQSNTIQASCRYRVSGGAWSSSVSMTVNVTDNTYFAYANLSGLDYKISYDFEVTVKDALSTVITYRNNVTGSPIFHWGREDLVFEVPVAFNKGVTTSEGKATSFPEYGEWTPELESANASYKTQKGWYVKAGNIVTIGFYVKAVCYPEDETTSILIVGAPYKPLYTASGGGICSGALIHTNKNFQCYAIDTNGFITTRGQNCDETNGTDLVTSSAACCYLIGKELTVSGTITYMIYE